MYPMVTAASPGINRPLGWYVVSKGLHNGHPIDEGRKVASSTLTANRDLWG